MKRQRTLYCVVRSGSVTGPWIVEATSESRLRESQADIAWVTPSSVAATDEAAWLNAREDAGGSEEEVSPISGNAYVFSPAV